jgi:excisionase family DNA binding protein
MMTVKQAAEQLGVSESLVYEWCAQGLLKHYRFAGKGKRGCIRIEHADLEAFLAASLHGTSPQGPALKHIILNHG